MLTADQIRKLWASNYPENPGFGKDTPVERPALPGRDYPRRKKGKQALSTHPLSFNSSAATKI